MPPVMKNHGKYVASPQKLTKWLGGIAEGDWRRRLPGVSGQELLWDGDRVIGVRVGDKGVDHDGNPKANYEPGPDLLAKIVILSEGPRGTLAKQAIAKLGLDRDRDPQVYAVGIKEIWQCPPGTVKAGSVIHTLAYPLPQRHVRRRLHLRDERRHPRHRAGDRPRLRRSRRPIRTTSSSAQAAPGDRADARRRANCCATARRRSPKAGSTRCRALRRRPAA